MIYIILFFVISAFSFLDLTDISKEFKYYLLLSIAVILWLFTGLRFETGTDYLSYYDYFKNVNQHNLLDRGFAAGYAYLNLISKLLFNNFNIFLLILGSISIGIKINFIRKYSPFWLLSLFMFFSSYFLTLEMGSIRMGIAIAILCFSIKYIKRRNLIKFIFIILIATLFHKFSFIFVIVYFLANKEYSNFTLIGIIVLSILLGNLNIISELVTLLVNSVPIPDFLHGKIISYFSYQSKKLAFDTGYFKKGFVVIIALLLRKRIKSRFEDYDLYLNICFLGYVLYFLFINSIREIGIRVPGVFVFFEIILIPSFLLTLENKIFKIFIYIVIIFLGLSKYLVHLIKWKEFFIPYKNILFM